VATISVIFLRINWPKLQTKMTNQFFRRRQTNREKWRQNFLVGQQILLQEHQAENAERMD